MKSLWYLLALIVVVGLSACGPKPAPRLSDAAILATAEAIQTRQAETAGRTYTGTYDDIPRGNEYDRYDDEYEYYLKTVRDDIQDYNRSAAAEATYMAGGDWVDQGASDSYVPPSDCPTLTANTNIREGPGTNYPIRTVWKEGTCIALYGKTSDAAWLQLADENGNPSVNWVSADLVRGEPASLPVTRQAAVERVEQSTSAPSCTGGCITYPTWCVPPIKGNVSFNSGERIYHVPGGEYYAATNIDPAYGERWFCTEAETQAAGWRRSRR